jgi:YaiO family outer membrane protein
MSMTFESFSQKNSLEVFNRVELWGNDLPNRTFTYLQYGRHTEKGDVYIRPTILNTRNKTAFLLDTDYYPKFKKGYGYFNFAYSNSNKFFPRMRLGGEIYKPIYKKFEASLGVRYINIIYPNTYNIPSITGTIGYYFGDFYTYIRPTVSILYDGAAWNGLWVTRRYFDKNYIELMVSRGVDTGIERNVSALENNFGLQTYMVRMKGLRNINELTVISIGYDFSGIFIPSKDEYVQINSVDLQIRRKF